MNYIETEYEKSINDCKKAIDDTSEEIINDIKSQKKFINVHKTVLEMYSYLLEEKYFNWNIIKEKLNYFEVTCKMKNITEDTPVYEKNKINTFLNKISKNINLNHDYLMETFPGLAVIFNWVKAIFKIYLYRLQSNLITKVVENNKKEENPIADLFPSYKLINLNKLDAFKSPNKIQRNMISSFKSKKESRNSLGRLKDFSDNLEIKSEEFKNTHETDKKEKENQFYITSIMSRNNENVITSDTNFFIQTNEFRKRENNAKSDNREKLNNQLKEKEIQIDINLQENHKQTMIKNFQNLPLIHVRTFHQLREYFNPSKKVKKNNSKSPLDLQKFSLNNTSNFEKMLRVLQKGNIGNLNRLTVLQFCKNIDNQNQMLNDAKRNKK